MQGKVYTVAQAAAAVGCNPRTIRRHLAAGTLPGAHQQHTAHGPAWRIPAVALDKLRAHLALDVTTGAVEVDVADPLDSEAGSVQRQQLAPPVPLDQSAMLCAALDAVRVALASQAATVEALRHAIDQSQQQAVRAQDDALWWRCEALDAQQQRDTLRDQAVTLRGQLAAVQVEAARLRAQVDHHQRPTVPLAQLRQQLRAVE